MGLVMLMALVYNKTEAADSKRDRVHARRRARDAMKLDIFSVDRTLHTRSLLQQLYSEANPEKLESVDKSVWQWRGQEGLLLDAVARKYPASNLLPFQAPANEMPSVARWACNNSALTAEQAKEGILGAVLAAAPITIFCLHDQGEEQIELLSQCKSIASTITAEDQANGTAQKRAQFVALDAYEYGWLLSRLLGLDVHEPHELHPIVPSMVAVAHTRTNYPRYFIGCQKYHCPESLPHPLDAASIETFVRRVLSGDLKGQGKQKHILTSRTTIKGKEDDGISLVVRTECERAEHDYTGCAIAT
jgi:hypothetical protein